MADRQHADGAASCRSRWILSAGAWPGLARSCLCRSVKKRTHNISLLPASLLCVLLCLPSSLSLSSEKSFQPASLPSNYATIDNLATTNNTPVRQIATTRKLLADVNSDQLLTSLESTFSGVSDEDQSPGLSPEVDRETQGLDKLTKSLDDGLKQSDSDNIVLNKKMKELQEIIQGDLRDVTEDVRDENKQLSDDIGAVPETVGPPGVPGRFGAPGLQGTPGTNGVNGLQGPPGRKGLLGVVGPAGGQGPRGPAGPAGKFGKTGIVGIQGNSGSLGALGLEGKSQSWKGAPYYCPEGQTDTMRLMDCSDRGCRLEVLFENEWGTVCSEGMNAVSGEILCKDLGFTMGGRTVAQYGGGQGLIWLDGVSCVGYEGDIGDCKHAPWGEVTCEHADDVGLCCFGGHPDGALGKRTGPSSFPRCPSVTTSDMRLVDCNKEVCRLEVQYNHTWGTVCDNGFTDTNAITMCKLMGFPEGKFKEMCATQGRWGGCKENTEGSGPIWLDDVVCLGFERDLEGCRHRPWGEHRCTHRQDVGICCSGTRGDFQRPGKCRHGELDYRFNENLESSTGGPDLAAPWGGSFDGVKGYRFTEGQGLGVDPGGCIGPNSYTVYLSVKLDQTIGERKLVHSNGWEEAGLYIKDSKLLVLPENEKLTCDQTISPNAFNQFVLTRDQNGLIRIFINGALCGADKTSDSSFLALNPDDILFLADYGLKNPSGYLNRIRVFSTALSEDEVAKISHCRLTERDKACPRHIEMNAALPGIFYSSVFDTTWARCAAENGNCVCNGDVRYGINGMYKTLPSTTSIACSNSVFGDPLFGVAKVCECKPKPVPGKGYSAGRMNSPQAWSARESTAGQWMQMDTGSIQSIAGVITQGRRDADQWVTSISVQVSSDAKDWIDVGCGRLWPANSDRNSKVRSWFHEPVKARYIRILPKSWYGHISMRAGILVCEGPCVDGELNYNFPLSYVSSTQGPPLDPVWGEGDFNDIQLNGRSVTVYSFEEGEGLQLDQHRCMKGALAWTILIDVRLDSVDGYRRILGSEGWGDYGLYVNRFLMVVPRNAHLVCSERIRTTKFYKFVMTRDEAGVVKLYVNGGLCASGSPTYKDHFQLNPDNIMIMRDDANENTGGELKNVHIWNKALVEKEVQSVCECTLPDSGDECTYTVVFNAPSAKTSYSSVWNHDQIGTGHARGRIGSKQAWSAAQAAAEQYMQLDTGFVQSISGIITQGRHDQDQWVTSYSVQVSTDGSTWMDVGCGTEFDANSDRDTKIKNYFKTPVKARYVRIYPQSWTNWISMRAGLLLCEKPCQEGRLEYDFGGIFASKTKGPSLDPAWGDGDFDDELGYRFLQGEGFELDASRCLQNPDAWTMVMRARLDSVNGYRAILTSQAWGDGYGLYVDKFLQLAPIGANLICDGRTILPNTFYYFAITRSSKGKVTLYINGAECAAATEPFKDHYKLDTSQITFLRDESGQDSAGYVKSILLWGKLLDTYEVAAQCDCLLPQVAQSPCDRLIEYTALAKRTKYSSVLQGSPVGTGYARGRLNSRGSWQPSGNKVGEWMEMDTGRVQTIAGVVTQGSKDQSIWVSSYYVKVSDDGFEWKDVRCQWELSGNSDQNSKKRNQFKEPVVGRFVRIYPTVWSGAIGLRAGVLLCMEPCSNGELYYELGKESLLSATDGPGLDTPWGPGYFTSDGYRFLAGQGFSVDENEELCMNNHKNITATDTNTAYTISMTVKLDSTSSWVRLVSTPGWGDDGVYINRKFQMFPPGANLKCAETIIPSSWYSLGITRTTQGSVSLYINGGKCATGRPGFSRGFMLDPHDIDFFHDDGNEDAPGYVKEIHIWNRALTDSEMAEYSGCQLNEAAPRCSRTISFSATYQSTKYSSVLGKSGPGIGFGRGRLNSPQAWIPQSRPGEEEYMQIDIGNVESLAGIITQGRRDANEWITSYTVQVSSDEVTWTPAFCGEVYDANSDRNTKVTNVFRRPISARFVRIIPKTWYASQSMRAGLLICEHKCTSGKLDYTLQSSFLSATDGPALDPAWGEGSFDNPSVGYRFDAGQGFVVDESTCLARPDNITILMDVSLDVTRGYQKLIGSDGWGNYGFYVNGQYQAYPSAAQLRCSENILPGVFYKYLFSRSADGYVRLYLNGYLCAEGAPPFLQGYLPDPTSIQFLHSDDNWNSAGNVKTIKIWNRVLNDLEAAKVSECYLATLGPLCSNGTVVLVPSYSRLRYSSSWGGYPMGSFCAAGRLGSSDAWCSSSSQIGEYIQIDTGEVQSIQGVVTQGRPGSWQWVASYKVSVSMDGIHFSQVQCGSVFDANTDMDTQVKNIFDQPVLGRYVRIFPQTWYNWMSLRAAALVCEKPCKSGQLNYQLLDDLLSTSNGPNLNAPWGFNTFDPNLGYRFYGGRGLQLDEGTCISGQGSWSMLFEISLDQTNSKQRLLASSGWGDNGLYISERKYSIFPGVDIQCKQPLLSNVFYRFIITRSNWGDVSLFANGYKCASGSPPYASGFQLNAHDIQFFHDNGANNAQGYVKHIELWNKVLSDSEAASVSGCTLRPPPNTACNSSFGYSPPDSSIKYSSIWSNQVSGVGHGRGRLNSPQAWSASWVGNADYMEIDVGQATAIAGIVTQGRQDYPQWVTLLQVTYSEDGKRWYQVQCGENFVANRDQSTKVTIQFDAPVQARYVRIWPIEWYNWVSMRAGVLMCEMQCKGGILDYQFANTLISSTLGPALLPQWGEGFFDTSSQNLGYRFGAGQGFSLDAINCIGSTDYTIIIEAQFDQTNGWVRLLSTSAWGDFGLYIKEGTYMLFPRSVGMSCQGAILPRFFYKFGLSRTQDGRVELYLNGYRCATKSPALVGHFSLDTSDITLLHDDGNDNSAGYVRRVRVWSQDFSEEDMAAMNECVPAVEVDPCPRTVVYNPPYKNIEFSSVYNGDQVGYGHGRARLDDAQAWSAATPRAGEYMQIDTGSVQKIAGIVTQMREDWAWQFVTAYSVAVSEDGSSWVDVQCGTTFKGNNPNGWGERDVKVSNLFVKPVKGRYVQIIVQAYTGWASMRAGVLICEVPCSDGTLDYPLAGDMMSSTNGPALEPVGGGGTFDAYGYRYNWGQGLKVNQKSCITDPSSYTIIINVRLDNTDTWNRLVYSNGWGRYGLFVQGGKFEFFPIDLGLVCPGLIQAGTTYQFGITHTSDAEVKLFLNGWKCATGMVFDAPNQLNLAADDLEFFRDPNNLHYYGYVSRIRVWGKVLAESEMMTAMGCRLPEDAKKTCTSFVVKNVPYSQMRFDAVYGNYASGQYYGKGRLNDDYGWLAPDYNQGHWIQLDLGSVLAVAGVVTQGMTWGWYTTSFSVKVSKDGRKWSSVECGRSYPGNTDWNTQLQSLFTNTVLAQYVRIYPLTYYGYANMRAGAIVCENECAGGKLDYTFENSFESVSEGPSLTIPWGQGSFDRTMGYRFEAGQGMQIPNRETCIKDATVYSVIINVRIAASYWSSGPLAQNWYSILTSEAWGDAGVYVNSVLMLKPQSVSCAEVIRSQYFYQFGVTRGTDGKITLYMNGYPCASGSPPYKKGYSLTKDITFLHGINSQSSAGYVKEIRVWDSTLTAEDMATQSGCVLNTEASTCSGLIVLNVPYSSMIASTVWGGVSMGTYWGSGQLDAMYGWIPNDWSAGKMWLQMDTGLIQTIAGVVTQGCGYYGYYNWYISSFWVQVSDDGSSWNYLECGRIYSGNSDWNTKLNTMFAKPVKARYVRILVESYNGYPTLRAGVLICETECSNRELHYELDSGLSSATGGPSLKVPWGQGSFQNQVYNFAAGQGLQLDEDACISSGDQYSILMSVNLQTVNSWVALFTAQNWGDSGLYVNSKYQLKGGALSCKNEPIRAGVWYKYGITRSKSGTVDLYLNGYKCASGSPALNSGFALSAHDVTFLRGINGQSSAGMINDIYIWGKTLSESDMRTRSGCTLPDAATDRCSSEVVLDVPYSQITASTVYAGYSIGQGSYFGQPFLNSPTSWLAYNWDANQWLQIDTGEVQEISGLMTQGSATWYAWTTQYKVMVSTDASTWNYVECGRIFDANSDMNTKVKNVFDYPVKAQYIRIMPVAWYNYVTLRAAVLLCETTCTDGTLDYQFGQSFSSSTNGPSLNGQWGEGYFSSGNARGSTNVWKNIAGIYHFNAGQGLRVTQKSCLTNKETYSVLIEAWLGDVTGWQAVMTADAWQDNGVYVNNQLSLKGTSIQCVERLRTEYYYQYGLTRDSDGLVTLYLNGYPCASGTPTESGGFLLDPKGMIFFRGLNGAQNTAGWVSRIRMWDSAITASSMAESSSCTLPEAGSQCSGLIELNVPYNQISASSVWYGYRMSEGWGQAQIDSQGSWAPGSWDQNQWLQLDTGTVQMIAGVVTQGSGNYWGYWAYYVTSFWVKVSNDGITWRFVECGRIFDSFTSSQYNIAYQTKIQTKFTQPVKARYVRIQPQGWTNGPLMRAGVLVCEPECKKHELNYEMQNSLASSSGGPSFYSPWGFGDFRNVQSDWRQPVQGIVYNFYTNRGGLQLKQSSCINNKDEYSVLIRAQISNVDPTQWKALLTAIGWNNDGLYVQGNFRLRPTTLVCSDEKIQAGYYYWFGITRTKKGVVSLYLNGNRCASGTPSQHDGFSLSEDDMSFFHGVNGDQTPQGSAEEIRIWSSVLTDQDVREVTGCALPDEGKSQCSDFVLLNLPVQSYTASNTYGGVLTDHQYCASPRIDSRYSWCPSNWNSLNFLQMDTGVVQTITGVVTQGYMYANYWVQSFKVRVSKDGSTWQDVECGRIFDGNTDYNTKLRTVFKSPVEARYVQILPLTWMNYPMMRAAPMVCEQDCKSGHLDYKMTDFRSATGGPDLQAPWGQGSFVPFVRDNLQDYPGWDIQFYGSMSFNDCEETCEQDERCGMALLYKAAGQGCWLKYAYGHDQGRGRTPHSAVNPVFHVDSLVYKLMAPVGYQFDGGQGLQLNEGNCIQSSTDYTILIDGMLANVGNGLKRLISSKGWGDKGVYLNNQMIGLFPSSSGLRCIQNIIPYYDFKFGMTRTSEGEIKLYVNGMLCASGYPSYANGYVLNPHDITFFYDSDANYQERGWIRRIQLWDSPLSDKEMATASGCELVKTSLPCSNGTKLFAAVPANLDFSSTYNRDEFGTGFGQGHRVLTTPYRTVDAMRSAGVTPPSCPASNLAVTVQRACNTKKFFTTKPGTFAQVRQICQKNGGELATLSSREDIDAAYCPGWCYIGLVRDTAKSAWYWLDGSKSTFRAWAGGEPGNSETKVLANWGDSWNDWATGEAVAPGICQVGAGGWANVTGEGLVGTLRLTPGQYPYINDNGVCDDSGNMCTVPNCGRMSLSEISGFQVPAGLKVVFYDQTWFQGTTITYTGPVNVDCLVADGWNDRPRSMKVLAANNDAAISEYDIGFWSPAPIPNRDVWGLGEWMQVDLGKKENISYVVTSGFQGTYRASSGMDSLQGSVRSWDNFNWQVTLFLLRVSDDAQTWKDVECGRMFQNPWQNTANKPVISNFTAPVVARYLRLYPVAWQNGLALRMQVGICDTPTQTSSAKK